MYATNLTRDFWDCAACRTYLVERPSWRVIEEAIRALDGKHRTLVTIAGGKVAHMTIGGGASGRYVVYGTFDNDHFCTLTSSDQSDNKLLLFIGGQEGDYTREIVVDLVRALRAAETFAISGQMDATLPWRNN
jgi:hypothetical protein